MKVKTERILVIVVKWSHRANGLSRPGYHGRNISGSQQSFLTETSMSNDGRKVWANVLLLIAIMPGKAIHVKFCLFFPYHELLRSENFATMVTWRNGFSSLLFTPQLTFNLKLSKTVKNYQRMPSWLWETYFLIFVKMDVCGLEHSLYCSRLQKALWMR